MEIVFVRLFVFVCTMRLDQKRCILERTWYQLYMIHICMGKGGSSRINRLAIKDCCRSTWFACFLDPQQQLPVGNGSDKKQCEKKDGVHRMAAVVLHLLHIEKATFIASRLISSL